MSGSPRPFPALIAVIASRNDTLPSLGEVVRDRRDGDHRQQPPHLQPLDRERERSVKPTRPTPRAAPGQDEIPACLPSRNNLFEDVVPDTVRERHRTRTTSHPNSDAGGASQAEIDRHSPFPVRRFSESPRRRSDDRGGRRRDAAGACWGECAARRGAAKWEERSAGRRRRKLGNLTAPARLQAGAPEPRLCRRNHDETNVRPPVRYRVLRRVFHVHGRLFGRDKGDWPGSWPKELEPLRKQSRTLVGPMVEYRHYAIPFTKREEFEAAWPHLLKVKTKGHPSSCVRGSELLPRQRPGRRPHQFPARRPDRRANPEAPRPGRHGPVDASGATPPSLSWSLTATSST